MNKQFYDNAGFLHDTSKATSGNKILYSSIHRELGGYKDSDWHDILVNARANLMVLSGNTVRTYRNTGNIGLDSLDNMVGFIYTGLIGTSLLKNSNWYFNGYDPKAFTWLECFKDLIKYRKELLADRNYWWENNLYSIGKLANLIPPHLRYYIKAKSGHFKAHLLPFFLLHILTVLVKPNFKKGVKQTTDISQKNITWLILRDIGSKYLVRFFNYDKNINDYYSSKYHPTRVLINTVR